MLYGPSALTLGASLAGQLLLLISGVVAARALGAEDRGHLALLYLAPMTISLIGGLGVPQATAYFIARETDNAAGVTGIAIRLGVALSAGLMLLYALGLLVISGSADREVIVAGVMSVLLVPAFLLHGVGLAVLQGQQRFRAFNAVRLVAPTLYAVSIAVLLVVGADTLTTVMALLAASWVTGTSVTWLAANRNLPGLDSPPRTSAREMLRFGIRGVFGSVSPIDDLRVDQLLVGLAVSPTALGLYVAAVSFSNLPRFIAKSIGLVSYPRIASAGTDDEAWAIVRRTLKIGVAFVTVSVTLTVLVVPVVLPFVYGTEFEGAVGIARILLAATFFLSLRWLFTEFARGLGHPGYGSIGELVSFVLLLIGVLVLVPDAGQEGVAWAVLIVSTVSSSILAGLLIRLKRRGSLDRPDRPDA